jgi:hypothetical protein
VGASVRNRRTAVIAWISAPIVGFAFGAFLAFTMPSSASRDNTANTAGTGARPVAMSTTSPSPTTAPPTTPPAASATPSPSPTPTRTPPRATGPQRDRTAPTIGKATSEVAGIWTDYWCSAGPTRTNISIPVQDRTDSASRLKVDLRFVLHREDGGIFDLDQVTVQSDSSPFTLQFGPYPGPNPAYAYNNTIDLVVIATDRAGNKTTRTFAAFLTFNDCKAGA